MSGYEFSRTPVVVPTVNTRHRTINTGIPAPGTDEILKCLDACEPATMHSELPIAWDHAYGHNVVDVAGNEFIDFTSGIFAANTGHNTEILTRALHNAIDVEALHPYDYPTRIRAEYLEKLTQWSGFDKAILLSQGTEATECALKLMRLHGQKIGRRRPGIICLEGAFHGRTMGAQMMSGNKAHAEWMGYQDPNIYHLPFPFPWRGLSDWPSLLPSSQDICGVMLETFQGWGAIFYQPEFVKGLAEYCREHEILLCFDEMQAGFGRTGKKFGFEHYGVTPDLICVGKGMGGGFPVSGVLYHRKAIQVRSEDMGDISNTHSGNPLACAAGLAVIEEIKRLDLVNESARKGLLLHVELAELKERYPERISWTLGKGMIAAVLFRGHDGAELASRVAERCMQGGLLVGHTGRESIKIAPPLTIPDDAILEGVAVLGEAIAEIEKEPR